MASFSTHIAIAKVYLNKNKVEHPKEFLKGVVEPDLVINKTLSHYSDFRDKRDLKEFLKGKVNLIKFLEGNNINSDYQKGVFLHLITDYEMYNNFFDEEYINNTTHETYCNNLYHSFDEMDEYLKSRYPVEEFGLETEIEKRISKKKQKLGFNKEKTLYQNVLPITKLEPWINKIGSINLEEYKNNILDCQK